MDMEITRPDYDTIFDGLVDKSWSDVDQLLFFEFCLLGVGRTFKRLVPEVKMKYPKNSIIQDLDLRNVYERGIRCDWNNRAHLYDHRIFMADATAIMARNHEMNVRHALAGQRLLDIAVERLEEFGDKKQISPNVAVQMMKEAAFIERTANEAELPKDRQADMPIINITISTDTTPVPTIPGVIVDASD